MNYSLYLKYMQVYMHIQVLFINARINFLNIVLHSDIFLSGGYDHELNLIT